MSKHFTDESWSDYVRGLSPEPEAAAIGQHLEARCETCSRAFALWRTVAETAGAEMRSDVPEEVVRASRKAFTSWWRRYALPKRARVARLIFDSMLQPLPAGVRGESPAPRRILQRVGSWSVDLRFEPASAGLMFLAGQIVRSGKHAGEAGAMPVILMSHGAFIDETVTSELGEFQMQFDPANSVQIYIDVPEQRPIGIILPDLGPGSAAGESRTD